MPRACRLLSITLPTPGISRTSSGARNFASSPGTIQRTPFGLACAEETLAISREVPIPTEQLSPVSAFMRWCRVCAALSGGPCRRSVPVMSR